MILQYNLEGIENMNTYKDDNGTSGNTKLSVLVANAIVLLLRTKPLSLFFLRRMLEVGLIHDYAGL